MSVVVSVVPWSIAQAGEVEVAAVVAMVRAAMAAKIPSEQRSAHRTRRMLDEWLATGRTGALAARGRGNELHGVAIVRNEPPIVRIVFLCTKYPRQGCGTTLARKVEELARRHRLMEVRAAINPADPVQAGFFIDHLGYTLSKEPAGLVDNVTLLDAVLAVGGGSTTASGMGMEAAIGAGATAPEAPGAATSTAGKSAAATTAGGVGAPAPVRIRISAGEIQAPSLGSPDDTQDQGAQGAGAGAAGARADAGGRGERRGAASETPSFDDALLAELEAAAERRARSSGRAPAASATSAETPAGGAGGPAPAGPLPLSRVAVAETSPFGSAAGRSEDLDHSEDDEPASDPGEATMPPGARGRPIEAPTAAPGVDQEEPGSRRALLRATARAVVISGDTKRRVSLSTKDSFLIGRAPDVDIVLIGRKASRHHCVLRWVGDRLIVEDLGSSNGTFLNGRAVARGELCEGDVVSVGRTRIGFDNLGSRSLPVEIAGRLPPGDVDVGDTHATTIRRMRGGVERDLAAEAQRAPAPPVSPAAPAAAAGGATPPPVGAAVDDPGALRRALEEQALRYAALEGIAEAARATATAAQQELGAERVRREQVERELQAERLRRERLTDRVRDLGAERDRLAAAVARVEQALGDVHDLLAAGSPLDTGAHPEAREPAREAVREPAKDPAREAAREASPRGAGDPVLDRLSGLDAR